MGAANISGNAKAVEVKEVQGKLAGLQKVIAGQIVGQSALIQNMLICLLCDGHMLIEGMPGLAKTTAAKALAQGVEGDFPRIQFTPALQPSALIGTEIYRAPAMVQSALLEAMEEKQITVGHHTYKLPELFMVLATQNPIEQEGTYNLPEAQLDRFLMYTVVGYPNHEEELKLLALDDARRTAPLRAPLPAPTISTQQEVFAARRA